MRRVISVWFAAWATDRLCRTGATPLVMATHDGRLGRSGVAAHAVGADIPGLGADAIQGLRRLGLDRVDQLAALPRAPLARRFGSEVLLRLDQAFDHVAEPIAPRFPPEMIQHRLTFPEPLTAEAFIPAIAQLTLATCAELAEALPWAQAAFAADISQRAELSALVDRLANRLGPARVFRIAPVQSDVPERAVRPVPALAPGNAEPAETSWPVTLPRPVRLFRPPQPVQALAALPDQPPAAFTWRRVRRRVRRSDGPERIHGEWWLRDGEARTVRDYWAVEDEAGHRYWLFRRGNGTDRATGDLGWFLHGLF